MKRKRRFIELYIFQGSTITSDVVVVAPFMSDGDIIMSEVSTHDNPYKYDDQVTPSSFLC